MTQPARILIVDDEPNVRLAFRTTLETGGYVVHEAADGRDALDRLETLSVSLVLLDLQMPLLGGMESLRRLREADNAVPVVVVTAHGSIPDAVAAMKLGAIDFLSKPLTPAELRRVVQEVVARHADLECELKPSHPGTLVVAATVLNLTAAKRALNAREFDRAEALLEQALDQMPDSAEAHNLMGVLRESWSQDHAAYRSYKAALEADPHYGPARDNMQRYCDRFGLDHHNEAINPAAK